MHVDNSNPNELQPSPSGFVLGSGVQVEAYERTPLLISNDSLAVENKGTSWYVSVFIVVNAGLGAGLLNFPAAFDKSGGLIIGITIQAVLMVFIIGALLILSYCSDINQSATYQDVVFSMCGRNVQRTSSIAIVFYAFGTLVTFFIIIGDNWDQFFSALFGLKFCLHWYLNRKFIISITSVVIVLPMCFAKRIDFLKYASIVGFFGILYTVVLVCVKYFDTSITHETVKTRPDTWTDIFEAVPVICFAYQCHISCVPVYACLKKRTQSEFLKTVLVALAICVFAYTGTASFGYLTFGGSVKEDILSSYDPTPDVLIAVILIAVKMYTTYPILLFVLRAAFESLWIDFWKLSPEDIVRGERRRRILSSLFFFTTSLALAIMVPNIGVVIAVLGGLAAIFIFIYPGLCLYQVILQGTADLKKALFKRYLLFAMASGYLIIGAFIFGLTTTQALWDDFSSNTPSKPPICS